MYPEQDLNNTGLKTLKTRELIEFTLKFSEIHKVQKNFK